MKYPGPLWRDGHDLMVHGLIYAIGDGLLQSVCEPVSRIAVGHAHPRIDDDENIL